jgi:glycosyltransferase involved in cell wall biosynthesis
MSSTPTPKFSICVFGKNEEKTIGRLMLSVRDFLDAGGEFCYVDTGSSDSTVNIAANSGARICYPRSFSRTSLDDAGVREVREYAFTDAVERATLGHLIKSGPFFDFGAARNGVMDVATNPWILMLDCDETVKQWDMEELNACCEQTKFGAYYHDYIWSHTPEGKPDRCYRRPYFMDRRQTYFSGMAHESADCYKAVGRLLTRTLLVEHFPETKDRNSYGFPALAVQSLWAPYNARRRYYLARELMYAGAYKSAAAHFTHYEQKSLFPAERAQALIFHGDCYRKFESPQLAGSMYRAAIAEDPNRREPWLAMAQWCKDMNQPQACAAYASAALAIKRDIDWDEPVNLYRAYPHHLLYWAFYKMGEKFKAKAHWSLCRECEPNNAIFQEDAKWF